MKQRTVALSILGGALVFSLAWFQPTTPYPVRAQSPSPTTLGYIAALGTRAALDTQATQSAYQQQSSAAQANANAAALEAQAAAARAQAIAQAGAATQQAVAQQQQAQIAQATADAAALQATAIAQQTRDTLSLQATQAALSREATRAAIHLQATEDALQRQRRDQEAIATQIAMSANATAQAKTIELRNTEAQAQTLRTLTRVGGLALSLVLGAAAILALWLMIKFFLRLIRRLDQPTISPARGVISPAGQSVVDAATGAVTRFVPIEYDDDPEHLAELLRTLYGDAES